MRPQRSKVSGVSLTETLMALLIGVTVMASVYVIFRHSRLFGMRAQDTHAAVQAGALLMMALQDDIANIVASTDPEDTVEAREVSPDKRVLVINRRDPSMNQEFESWVTDESQLDSAIETVVSAQYLAELNQESELWRITRQLDTETAAQAKKFGDIYAKDVRFATFSEPGTGKAYVRVSMLLLGEERTLAAKSAYQNKPTYLSMIFYIPTREPSPFG